MIVLLTLLTAIAALLFLATVAVALVKIAEVLESIGGTGTSFLAKLRLGLRAIERETSHIPGAAVPLNEGLGEVAGGLMAVDATLGELHEALVRQEATK